VAALGLDRVVVETGGVGLAVVCPPRVLGDLRAGEPAHLFTTLVVREDALTLYGFATDDERDLFDTVLGVSGIGPRLGLAMLAVLTPDEIRTAVSSEDTATLTRVPGVGRKGAQRLVLELRDRLVAPAATTTQPAGPGPAAAPWAEQVTAALVGLGWGAKDAARALDVVAPQAASMSETGDIDVPALLRAALRSLDRP
jgi:Holliday junction DNA helicase RuvA